MSSLRPILIACPNLSLDRTIEVPSVALGHVHRSIASDSRGGGKGINVARALKCTGRPSLVVGFAAGRTGDAVLGLLEDEGIETVPVVVEGETRSCLTVLSDGRVTVFNEAGPTSGEEPWARFHNEVMDRLAPGGVFVCSGSFPPGSPPGAAARLVRAARERGCTVVCDTAGAQLEGVLAAQPDVITPNLSEAADVLGEGEEGEPVEAGEDALEHAVELADALLDHGPAAVLVTAGAAGAVLAQEGAETAILHAPAVSVLNPVGAGDCLVAGLAAGLSSSADLVWAARRGIAMAAASCETFPAGLLDPARADALMARHQPWSA